MGLYECLVGVVDLGDGGELGWGGVLGELGGVGLVGVGEGDGALSADLGGGVVVDVGWGV